MQLLDDDAPAAVYTYTSKFPSRVGAADGRGGGQARRAGLGAPAAWARGCCASSPRCNPSSVPPLTPGAGGRLPVLDHVHVDRRPRRHRGGRGEVRDQRHAAAHDRCAAADVPGVCSIPDRSCVRTGDRGDGGPAAWAGPPRVEGAIGQTRGSSKLTPRSSIVSVWVQRRCAPTRRHEAADEADDAGDGGDVEAGVEHVADVRVGQAVELRVQLDDEQHDHDEGAERADDARRAGTRASRSRRRAGSPSGSGRAGSRVLRGGAAVEQEGERDAARVHVGRTPRHEHRDHQADGADRAQHHPGPERGHP